MALLPSRKRAAANQRAKTRRTLAAADAAYAFTRDRIAARSLKPAPKPAPRRRASIAAGAVAGAVLAAGGVLFKRKRGGGGEAPAAPAPSEVTPTTHAVPPQPSNYDAPGPAANTATPIPAPDAQGLHSIDEEAEIEAAAAEAAAIGGTVSEYAGPDPDEAADEALAPLMEAGEGEAEGSEQAEAALRDAAEPSDAPSPYERQIDDVIEGQDEPATGETPEPLVSDATDPAVQARIADDEPTPEPAGADVAPAGGDGSDKPADDGGDWQTWSGQSVRP